MYNIKVPSYKELRDLKLDSELQLKILLGLNIEKYKPMLAIKYMNSVGLGMFPSNIAGKDTVKSLLKLNQHLECSKPYLQRSNSSKGMYLTNNNGENLLITSPSAPDSMWASNLTDESMKILADDAYLVDHDNKKMSYKESEEQLGDDYFDMYPSLKLWQSFKEPAKPSILERASLKYYAIGSESESQYIEINGDYVPAKLAMNFMQDKNTTVIEQEINGKVYRKYMRKYRGSDLTLIRPLNDKYYNSCIDHLFNFYY